MGNTPSEVLIYLQSVKNYFNSNNEAKEYFIGDGDEELFYTHLTDISQKNFEKNGEVMLDKEQFELLRTTIQVIHISTKKYTKFEIKNEDFNYDNGVFIGLPFPNFGLICLN
jgi:hypothetical protein